MTNKIAKMGRDKRRDKEDSTRHAVIANNAADADDDVFVIEKSFDGKQRHGPCRWHPRTKGSGVFYPRKGDPCIISEPDPGDQMWITSWKPKKKRAPDRRLVQIGSGPPPPQGEEGETHVDEETGAQYGPWTEEGGWGLGVITGGTVPSVIEAGFAFFVPAMQKALWTVEIVVEGELRVFGEIDQVS